MSDYHLGAQQTDAGVPGGTPTGSSTPPAPGAGATLTQEQVNAIVAEERRKWKAAQDAAAAAARRKACLLYTSPSPRDGLLSRMPSSA